MNRIKNILITGQQGIGKTTFIKNLAEEMKDLHPSGFYATGIREAGIRRVFALISLDGRKGILSYADIKSPYKASKYACMG